MIDRDELRHFLDGYLRRDSIIGRLSRAEVMTSTKLTAAIKRASFMFCGDLFDEEVTRVLLAEYQRRRTLAAE